MYYADMETRLREHTMRTKKYIVELKILPYFGNKRVNDITAADIRQWCKCQYKIVGSKMVEKISSR